MRWPRLVVPFAQSVEVSASVDADGIDEDGAPIEGASWSGMCNWQDSVSRSFTKDRTEVEVNAVLYIDGDAFPSMRAAAGGIASIGDEQREIVKVRKNRNPDGTVNNTELWLR